MACLKAYDALTALSAKNKPGYFINTAKSKMLWAHDGDPPGALEAGCRQRGLQIVRESAKYLGTRVGKQTVANQTDHMDLTLAGTRTLLERLTHKSMLKGNAIILLKACVLPKMGYLTRNMPYTLVKKKLYEWDDMMLAKFYEIMGLDGFEPLDQQNMIPQITAPVRLGGFGLTLAEPTGPGANLSALCFAHEELFTYKCKMSATTFNKLPVVMNMTTCHTTLLEDKYLGPKWHLGQCPTSTCRRTRWTSRRPPTTTSSRPRRC